MDRTVLVCDDERYILETVAYLVRQEGYRVLTAEGGREALRLAQAERPDLLLLDIAMPDLDGYAVCRQLKSAAATRGIYIILLTCLGQESDLEEGWRSGADELLSKPFDPRQLRRKLHQLLDG